MPQLKGEANFQTKLAHADVLLIRQSKWSCRRLAAKLGVSHNLVWLIRKGINRKDG